jgi:hypothetical protein
VVHAHIKSSIGSDAGGDTVMLRSVVIKYDGFMTCPVIFKSLAEQGEKAPCKYRRVCYREGVDMIWRVVPQRVHATLDLRAEAQIGDALNGV